MVTDRTASEKIGSYVASVRPESAPPDALEGPLGFTRLFASGEDLQPSLDSLGQEPCELLASGAGVKKHRAWCGVHRAADGILELMAERPIPVPQIERIRITVEPNGLTALVHQRPKVGLEGKFSM